MRISKLTWLVPVFLVSTCLPAQNSSGKIFFTESIKLQLDLDENAPEEMKKMLPPEQKISKVLTFNEKASLYKNAGAADDGNLDLKHNDDEGGEMNIVIKMPEVVQFTDFENENWLRAEDFFGRKFLVSGDSKKMVWKLTGEQKKINEFVCQKAILQDSAQQAVAWFTPQIPVAGGPGRFVGLPGMVLDLEMDGGNRSIRVTKIEFVPVADSEIVRPTEGKAVSEPEFEKIRDEKLKEMGIEPGGRPGGPRVKMIIQNDDRN